MKKKILSLVMVCAGAMLMSCVILVAMAPSANHVSAPSEEEDYEAPQIMVTEGELQILLDQATVAGTLGKQTYDGIKIVEADPNEIVGAVIGEDDVSYRAMPVSTGVGEIGMCIYDDAEYTVYQTELVPIDESTYEVVTPDGEVIAYAVSAGYISSGSVK